MSIKDKDKYITGDFVVHLFNIHGALESTTPTGTYLEARIKLNKHMASGKNLAGAILKVVHNDFN
jgi:hypothetical protein